MAQTRRRRRRKRRGTQGGRIDDRPRGRPRNRAEARQRAQSRRSGKSRSKNPRGGLSPPTWRSAFVKGGVAALLFFALMALAFGRAIGPSAGLAAFMLAFYVPMSYYTDRFFYRRRLRQAEKERLERAEG